MWVLRLSSISVIIVSTIMMHKSFIVDSSQATANSSDISNVAKYSSERQSERIVS